MPVTGILQSHNRTPKCFSLLKSCRANGSNVPFIYEMTP
ncbi:hypothetical protein T06_771 [Trichinella sp. T6]|nr:hypothetical protein T06_771 [Trichinella sp. T6]